MHHWSFSALGLVYIFDSLQLCINACKRQKFVFYFLFNDSTTKAWKARRDTWIKRIKRCNIQNGLAECVYILKFTKFREWHIEYFGFMFEDFVKPPILRSSLFIIHF